LAFAALAKRAPFTERVLIIGAGVSGSILAQELHRRWSKGDREFQLVGFVDDDPQKLGLVNRGFPVLANAKDATDRLASLQVDLVALAINRVQVGADVFSLLISAKERGIRVCSMPSLYETLTEKIVVEHVGDNWGIMFPVEQPPRPFIHEIFVRVMDITCALVGIVLTFLLTPILSAVRFASGSSAPIILATPVVTKGGRVSHLYQFALGDSKFGRWCTRRGLDRLPASINLLRGELSLIGPEPERPEFTQLLTETIPFFRARHAVNPGLTGWAQVMYRYDESEVDSLVKLQYDLYYIKHRSAALDLRILALALRQFFWPR
jgi:lipopolysaccharide/colanic/teichoic acid biosynthesis glycosyltransferase